MTRARVKSLSGKRVTVVGLGRFGGGIGVTRWLCDLGADVTVSDCASRDKLADSVRQLGGCDVTLHLGGHDLDDFLGADLLVVSPAVPPDLPALQAAAEAGIEQTTEINLFLERCRAPVVGITGSVGKSTTTAMAGEILSRRFTVHVGGNIGRSLLADLDSIRPDHLVVLEMSSFQLEATPRIGVSPHVALVTNLVPNHLDRHGTMEAYAHAKQNIFRFQNDSDVLILNAADEALKGWARMAPGRAVQFDPAGDPFELNVLGGHNQANAQAAWSAARECGIDRATAAEVLEGFKALPHRLQLVASAGGVKYYNDSKCTTPGGAVVAIEAFEPRKVVLIAGGYNKGVSFDELGDAIAGSAKALVVIGATADKIAAAAEESRCGELPAIRKAGDLRSAVAAASDLASAGDVVLLSPACASYDMFVNYEQRGEQFAGLAADFASGGES